MVQSCSLGDIATGRDYTLVGGLCTLTHTDRTANSQCWLIIDHVYMLNDKWVNIPNAMKNISHPWCLYCRLASSTDRISILWFSMFWVGSRGYGSHLGHVLLRSSSSSVTWTGLESNLVKIGVRGWFTWPCFSWTLISVVAMYINVVSGESRETMLKQLWGSW